MGMIYCCWGRQGELGRNENVGSLQRGLIALLASCLGLAAAQPGLPTGASQSAPDNFLDVSDSHWAADAIDRLAALGVITGYPNGTFAGSRAATRYELAVVSARLLDLLSASINDIINDPDFQRAIEDAASNNERLARLEQLVVGATDTEFTWDLAERLAQIESYLNEQSGHDLFPGLESLDDPRRLSVNERDPLDDEQMAQILSSLEQQLLDSRALKLPDVYFGVAGGHPVIGSLQFGVRNVFLDNLGFRSALGYSLPGALSVELAAFWEWETVFGQPGVSIYVGPGALIRVGSGVTLDAELLAGVEYSLPRGSSSVFLEIGPSFTVVPNNGDITFVARAGMNYGF